MKLSICIITYNHEAYIARAIESALSQQTSFTKEIIIGEDYSTDNTRRICGEYAAKYPELIRLMPSAKNIGMMRNFERVLKSCQGQYIAFMEGDDYWTDSLKLQKQVNMLDANPQFSACFHNVIIKHERNNEYKEWVMHEEGLQKTEFDTEDVLGPWFIATCSFMFVNYPDFVLPEWFFSCKYGDLPFMLLLSLRGNFGYINDIMAVYRLHENGQSIKQTGYDKVILMIYIYESFNIHTGYKYRSKVREAMLYEMDRHIPPKEPTQPQVSQKETGLLQRGYRKIRRLLNTR